MYYVTFNGGALDEGVLILHVDFKKAHCRLVEFKKCSCRPIDFKKMSMFHVAIFLKPMSRVTKPKKGPCRRVDFRGLGP